MTIGEIDTPAVLIDVDIMERNLRRLATYCEEHGLNLRPHTKTHKIPEIARRQMELGAVGITVAKVGEAEVMADAGLDDILIVYPILGELKLRRLVALASRVRLIVAADSFEVAQADLVLCGRGEMHYRFSGGVQHGISPMWPAG